MKKPATNAIKVPKVRGPKGICWKTGPLGTVLAFHHCTFKKHHPGKCQWDKPNQ